jgi:hypothetical protein
MNLDLQNARKKDLENLMNFQISKFDEFSEISRKIIRCWNSKIERKDSYIKNVDERRIAFLFNWKL